MCHLSLVFPLSATAFNPLYVAVSEEELPFALPGPHVQRCAGGEAALSQEDSNWVRKLRFDAQ